MYKQMKHMAVGDVYLSNCTDGHKYKRRVLKREERIDCYGADRRAVPVVVITSVGVDSPPWDAKSVEYWLTPKAETFWASVDRHEYKVVTEGKLTNVSQLTEQDWIVIRLCLQHIDLRGGYTQEYTKTTLWLHRRMTLECLKHAVELIRLEAKTETDA